MAGIPCSRIYTHVAARVPRDEGNNAPISLVFNPYARPGWTTCPTGTLANGFQPLYDALEKHGNPARAGVEANAAMALAGQPVMPGWESYLGWHYNHGANQQWSNRSFADVAARQGSVWGRGIGGLRKISEWAAIE